MNTKVTLSSRVFPGGAAVPGGLAGTLELPAGATETLSAPNEVEAAAGSQPPAYTFLFWNVDATLHTSDTATFPVPSGQAAFDATAWYLPAGGGGNGGPGVSAAAFSLRQNAAITKSPIASVSPATAQTGPESVSTNSSSVTIAPVDAISPFGEFDSWGVLIGGGTAENDGELVVGKGVSVFAIAFYAIPHPDPCQSNLDAIGRLGRIPAFGSVAEAAAWFRTHPAEDAAWKSLIACQNAHGEPATPPTVNGQPVPL